MQIRHSNNQFFHQIMVVIVTSLSNITTPSMLIALPQFVFASHSKRDSYLLIHSVYQTPIGIVKPRSISIVVPH